MTEQGEGAAQDPDHAAEAAHETDSATAESPPEHTSAAERATASGNNSRRKAARRSRTGARVFAAGEPVAATAATELAETDGERTEAATAESTADDAAENLTSTASRTDAAVPEEARATPTRVGGDTSADGDDELAQTAAASPTTVSESLQPAATGGVTSSPTTAQPPVTAAVPSTASPTDTTGTDSDDATTSATPVATTTTATAASTNLPSAQWTPTADVLQTLAQLLALYGLGDGGTPGYTDLPTAFQTSSGISAATAAELELSLYQENQAAAYLGLDSQLAQYLNNLAGDNAGSRAEARQIIAQVDTQLAALAAGALTANGQQELRQTILTDALNRADQLFGQSQNDSAAIQREVNQLAQVYVDALEPEQSDDPDTPASGTVQSWINQAIAILEQEGIPASELSPTALAIIIDHESSGNPDAINLTDSNAAAGDASKGLMQTTTSTFDEYAVAGHTDIWNPVDNIVAASRYAIARYGSLSNVPGVVAVESGGSYVGY